MDDPHDETSLHYQLEDLPDEDRWLTFGQMIALAVVMGAILWVLIFRALGIIS
jgi:hypothetical protein